MKKTAISLFSGAGGDSLGLEQAGYHVVAFSERQKDAIATHQARFPESVLLQHEKTTNIQELPDNVFSHYAGKINLIFAGFPCQGFSQAGKKKADDPRNELVHEFVRATRLIQPEWIIGENVKGILSRDGMDERTQTIRPVIEIIRDLFRAIGYQITWQVLDASDYGVPQCRKRTIIVGRRGMQIPHWEAPPVVQPRATIRPLLQSTLADAIPFPYPQLAKGEDDSMYWIPLQTNEMISGKPHPNLNRLVQGIRSKTMDEKKEHPEEDEKKIVEDEPSLSYGRRVSSYHGEIVHPDAPSKTIICTYQSCPRLFVGMTSTDLSQRWLRTFTVTELAQLQGFPKNYPFQGNTKSVIQQIGNAVPPPLIYHVVKSLENITFSSE
jgi:DNA (cytosine-5)-methyltransferase 1